MRKRNGQKAEELLQIGFRYAYALAHHQQDAEDLVQTAWLKLYQQHGEVKNQAILFTTIRNSYIDLYRRRKRVQFEPLETQDYGSGAADQSGQTVQDLDLDRLLARLRDVERETLFLNVVEGYSASEIADMMGKPRGTVLSLIHRSRQKLIALATMRERSAQRT